MNVHVVSWDWREQPNMEAIARHVSELSSGQVIMRELSTGSDQYAWVLADRAVSDDEAMAVLFGEEDL
jgi:hypothetical protein